ncbi:hypothetical protein Daus18300_012233, partial [Diaporthe australafricana]
GQTKKSVTLSFYSAASSTGSIIGPLLFKSSDAPKYELGLKITLGIYIGIFWAVIVQVVNLVLLNRAQEKRRVAHEKPAKLHDHSMEEKYVDITENNEHYLGNFAFADLTDKQNNEFVQEGKTDAGYAAEANVEAATGEAGASNAELETRLKRLEQLRNHYGVRIIQQFLATYYLSKLSTWDGPDDPDDPYNWASWRKVTTGIIFSFGQLVTLMTASMIAAALGDISADLGIDAATAQIFFATYFLGLAFGPFLSAAFAEVYGRKWVWVAGNIWYILWNGISPVGNSKDLMIVSRLMTGFGASAGVTLTGPTMADMYGKKERGKAVAIASLLPYLGPALGPIIGGIVTQMIAWQWIFWIMCAFNGLTTLIGVLCIRESYTPVLLLRKARIHQTAAGVDIEAPSLKSSLNRLGVGLWRPFRLLLRRPVVQIIDLILALDFAIYTLLLGTFANLFLTKYGQSESTSSLHYIAIAIGATSAAQIGGRLMDWSYRRMTARNGGGMGKPEFRVPYLVPAVIITALGLFLYGWTAHYVVAWPAVDVGAAIFTLRSFMTSQMFYAYQLDEFVEHAASANAATRVLSYSLGFAFPIFGPDLYDRLGYGWGNSMLAFLWVVVCFPMPTIFWLWGDKLRAMGRGSKEGQVDSA